MLPCEPNHYGHRIRSNHFVVLLGIVEIRPCGEIDVIRAPPPYYTLSSLLEAHLSTFKMSY